ncbi:MAG: peptidyl-alpha-hydroxyglycine alpha-amidating lyase family protein [Gemmatimonadota bacterium]
MPAHLIPTEPFRPAMTFMAATAAIFLTACTPADERPDGHASPTWTEVDAAWGELPDGRSYGAVSALYPSPDGESMWVAERCGQNDCADRPEMDPVLHFNLDGTLERAFGAGDMAWPHGMFVDAQGNVWVTDAVGFRDTPEGLGHVVLKYSPEGELLMTLGTKGEAGSGPNHFTKPSDVLVAPDGHIFVADGHDAGGNNRIVKFDPEGNFVLEWGSTGGENGEFRDPHALALDSQGRLFVADRANNRIQLFDQEGNHLSSWTSFSRISGLFIDENDMLYAVDSESNMQRNPGWQRGIYIGSVTDARVVDFIPDSEPDPDNSGTSGGEGVAVDARGDLYTGEVGPQTVRKFTRN